MFNVVLVEPEIPPNTGNVIRLCANTGCRLHLVEPLGFSMEDKLMRRAGLDYHEYTRVHVHDSLADAKSALAGRRWLALSTRGKTRYDSAGYAKGDVLLFGPETRGLPAEVLEAIAPEQRIYLPQQPGMRSLNLSNAVAITVYEAWRQLGFPTRAAEPSSSPGLEAP